MGKLPGVGRFFKNLSFTFDQSITGYLGADCGIDDLEDGVLGVIMAAEFDHILRKSGWISFLIFLALFLIDLRLLNLLLGATSSIRFNTESINISSSKMRISTSKFVKDDDEFESDETNEELSQEEDELSEFADL